MTEADQTPTETAPSIGVDDISPETAALLDASDEGTEEALDLSAFAEEDGADSVDEAQDKPEEAKADDADQEQEEAVDEKAERYSQALKKLSRKEKEIAAKEAEIKERAHQIEVLEKRAENYREDPIGFMKSMIGSLNNTSDEDAINEHLEDFYNQFTMHLLGADAPAELQEASNYQKLQREFEKYKREQEMEKLTQEEQRKELELQARKQEAINVVSSALTSQADKFPVLLAHPDYDAPSLVYQAIEQDYMAQIRAGNDSPTELSIDEAAEAIEAQLRQEAQKWASFISTDSRKPSTGQPARNRPTAKSLNQNNTVAAPARTSQDAYIEDDEESVNRAIAMIREI